MENVDKDEESDDGEGDEGKTPEWCQMKIPGEQSELIISKKL